MAVLKKNFTIKLDADLGLLHFLYFPIQNPWKLETRNPDPRSFKQKMNWWEF